MGAVPSTPRGGAQPRDAAEQLMAAFVGEKPYPLSSEFWNQLLELPLTMQWPQDRVLQACQLFAQHNYHTSHLAKILIHLVWSLQDLMLISSGSSTAFRKSVNAACISSVFLKFMIENAKSENFEELCLNLDKDEMKQSNLPTDQSIEVFVMQGMLNFIGASDVSPGSCLLHHELLNLMLVAMSTQLCSGPSPGPKDVHPFIDAAMLQESDVVASAVCKLLMNFITRPHFPFDGSTYPFSPEGNQLGVLQRVGSAAANFVLLPYYTFNYLLSSSAEGARSPLAEKSLLVLLVLIHYRKCIAVANNGLEDVDSTTYLRENSSFYDNPYCKALENARDIQFDRVDIEGNAHNGPLLRIPFASLFDRLAVCLADEMPVLLLYSLVHGNSDFLEYVLVRTDLDTLLMPILETLYNASKRTSNQIYMLLIILLILSQDSSFNASIHKLMLPSVPWYEERLLHHTSLGSLMVIVLIRTVKYNLSKLRDIYLHTNCLAILANMAPHVHRLSAFASQRLVSLFDMLSRKYTKLAELKNDKVIKVEMDQIDGVSVADDMSPEIHIYTDFLRIVLEILNAILTYALPRNPEVVYAILHRQEVFQPFKSHPRFNELLENLYTVLDFFNSRMDMQKLEGEWSVDKVLQVIIINSRSWRGEGMKMFTQLKFTYEQESHPEEFFIPYVWRLVLSHGFTFNPGAINLFPVELSGDDDLSGEQSV
ncbi:dymeclin [Canna indica]|uniref:Dymeclin n=1 Tax=Canna indica TaxID=4628 RepID=A0AAQ3JXK2_9LILI|nr:dymeclin [Canna indica]